MTDPSVPLLLKACPALGFYGTCSSPLLPPLPPPQASLGRPLPVLGVGNTFFWMAHRTSNLPWPKQCYLSLKTRLPCIYSCRPRSARLWASRRKSWGLFCHLILSLRSSYIHMTQFILPMSRLIIPCSFSTFCIPDFSLEVLEELYLPSFTPHCPQPHLQNSQHTPPLASSAPVTTPCRVSVLPAQEGHMSQFDSEGQLSNLLTPSSPETNQHRS